MQQARKARAEHAVKCKFDAWQKNIEKKKKLLTELYANGSSIEDGGAWETESQRHCCGWSTSIPRRQLTNKRNG